MIDLKITEAEMVLGLYFCVRGMLDNDNTAHRKDCIILHGRMRAISQTLSKLHSVRT